MTEKVSGSEKEGITNLDKVPLTVFECLYVVYKVITTEGTRGPTCLDVT
jgi:hypothetical protein